MRTADRRFQKIFRRAGLARIKSELRDGKALKGYFEESFRVKPKEVMLSTIELRGKPPKLKAPKRDPVSADLRNAIALHSYYSNLDETLNRLEWLVRDFAFDTVKAVLDAQAPVAVPATPRLVHAK